MTIMTTDRFGSSICLTRMAVRNTMRVKSMRLINLIKMVLLLMSVFAVVGVASAQDGKPVENPTPDPQRPADNKPKDPRAEALGQLALTKEQMLQIRRLN